MTRRLHSRVAAPTFRMVLMCVIVGLVGSSAWVASAQRRRGAQASQQRARQRAVRARRRAAARRQAARSQAAKKQGGNMRDEGRAPTVPPLDSEGSADVQSSREVGNDGSKVKVIEFTGLDISGRLKSPSLLYFLNRVRTEFDRPRLPHRSFIPEVERSAQEHPFE